MDNYQAQFTQVQTNENKKLPQKNIALIIVLSVVVLALASLLIWSFSSNTKDTCSDSAENPADDNSLSDNVDDNNRNNLLQTGNYKIGDFVAIDNNYTVNNTCADCWHGTVSKITFTNLPEKTTFEFLDKHTYATGISAFDRDIKNLVKAEVKGSVLSIFTEQSGYHFSQQEFNKDAYSLNLDLGKKRVLTNRELINVFGTDLAEINKKVLRNIASEITTSQLLESTEGNVDANSITIDEFKNQISSFAESIDNRYDAYILYILDGKLMANYDTYHILRLLGLGSHMGIGLPTERSTISAQ